MTGRWRLALAAVLPIMVLTPADPASAAWARATGGTGAGRAVALVPMAAPTASRVTSSVTLTWAAYPGPIPVRYIVRRNGAALGGSCSGTVNGTSCVDPSALGGATYTVAPTIQSWTGPDSPPSAPS